MLNISPILTYNKKQREGGKKGDMWGWSEGQT